MVWVEFWNQLGGCLLWFFCCDLFLSEQKVWLCAGHGFFQWYQLSLSDFRLVVLCPGFCLQQVRSLITNLYIRHNWIYSQTQAAMDIYQTIWCRHKPLWIYARPFGADTSRYGYMPDHLVQTQATMDICQTIWCRHKPLWIYARPFGADTSHYGYIPDHLVQTQASMDIYQTIWCTGDGVW